MIALYYIGGPMDLTKKALAMPPRGDVERVVFRSNFGPSSRDDPVAYRDEPHEYRIHKLARDTFIAVSEDVSR